MTTEFESLIYDLYVPAPFGTPGLPEPIVAALLEDFRDNTVAGCGDESAYLTAIIPSPAVRQSAMESARAARVAVLMTHMRREVATCRRLVLLTAILTWAFLLLRF